MAKRKAEENISTNTIIIPDDEPSVSVETHLEPGLSNLPELVTEPVDTNRVDMAGTLLRALLANNNDIDDGGLLNLMTQNSSYFQNMFQGNLTPVKRKRRATPALERTHKFDSNREGNYNLVKVFTHYPTLEYPTVSTFIQFTKGNSTVFMRLNDLEMLDHIAQFLVSTKVEIEALMPELKKMEMQTQQKANEAENQNLTQKMLIEQLLKGNLVEQQEE